VQAGSATWATNPTSGDWNTAANWTPATVPNGLTDIATFAASGVTEVSIKTAILVSSIIFSSKASAFTISVTSDNGELDIASGIENQSSSIQNFYLEGRYNGATIFFIDSASAMI
jgi:hypothetical protein